MTGGHDVLLLKAARNRTKSSARTAILPIDRDLASTIVQTAAIVRDNPGLGKIEIDGHRAPMTFCRDDLDGSTWGVPVDADRISRRTDDALIDNPRLVVDHGEFWVVGRDPRNGRMFVTAHESVERLATVYRLAPETGLPVVVAVKPAA